jgi:subtilase family serine protease
MNRHRRRPLLAGAAAAVTAAVLAAAGCGATGTVAPGPGPGPGPGQAVEVTAACTGHGNPLGAQQLRAAYQAGPADTGAGTTIAVIAPALAPRVASDVAVYSARYGLPTPHLRVLAYGDALPPATTDLVGNEQEGTVDLEVAHAIAPDATLIYLAASDTVDSAGMPVMFDDALTWLVTREHVSVVEYSAGIPETWATQNLLAEDGDALITGSRAGLEAAARAGTTVVAAAGDHGADEPGPQGGDLQRTVTWPASDPLVTAVGGTRLTARIAGGRTVYVSSAQAYDGSGAGGGGLSQVFARPSWQDGAAAVTGSRRGVPDITMDASFCSPAAAFTSENVMPGRSPGWLYVGGSSIAAPLFAGVVADAAQLAGHPLGVLGPLLYQMRGPGDGITDITSGTTSLPGIPGYQARPGYDLASGLGTIASTGLFARDLARLAGSRARAAAG